jgi:hypothetical protein
MHRLPGDLGDARQFGSRELGPGLEHAEDDVLLRGQPYFLQRILERSAEPLVGKPEQVAQVRLRSGVICQGV